MVVAVGRVVTGSRRRGGRRGQGRLEGQLLLVTLQVRPLGLVANASLGCRPGTSGRALTVALSISSSSTTMGSSKYHLLVDKTGAKMFSTFMAGELLLKCCTNFFFFSLPTKKIGTKLCLPNHCTLKLHSSGATKTKKYLIPRQTKNLSSKPQIANLQLHQITNY